VTPDSTRVGFCFPPHSRFSGLQEHPPSIPSTPNTVTICSIYTTLWVKTQGLEQLCGPGKHAKNMSSVSWVLTFLVWVLHPVPRIPSCFEPSKVLYDGIIMATCLWASSACERHHTPPLAYHPRPLPCIPTNRYQVAQRWIVSECACMVARSPARTGEEQVGETGVRLPNMPVYPGEQHDAATASARQVWRLP
jgi:hypothetical protein